MYYKDTWFLTIAGGQSTASAFGCCVAGPTNRKEDENKPVALSVFTFDWAEDKQDMELNTAVVTSARPKKSSHTQYTTMAKCTLR